MEFDTFGIGAYKTMARFEMVLLFILSHFLEHRSFGVKFWSFSELDEPLVQAQDGLLHRGIYRGLIRYFFFCLSLSHSEFSPISWVAVFSVHQVTEIFQ